MKPLLLGLLRLFPAPFQRRFAPDMVEQIETDYDRARALGVRATTTFTLSTAFDLIRSGLQERRDPTWRPPAPGLTREGRTMTIRGWSRDLRFALRALHRAPGFVLVTVATLALAIGVNAALFAVVNAVLLDPLPFQDADDLIVIRASAPGTEFPSEFGVSAEFYLQYGEQATTLRDVATMNSFTATLRALDRTERVRMSTPTPSLFRTLGATPILGRLPEEEDSEQVALISHALWTSWFDADPQIVGKAYDMAGGSRTIIGVMGPEFWFPREDVLLWIPVMIREEGLVPGRFGISLLARAAPNATREEIVAELELLAGRLPERFGGSAAYADLIAMHRPVVRSLEETLLGPVAGPLWILLGAVAIVLLIACANVANLFMVRAERRQRDLAIRRALGAGRARLVRSQMTEAIVIAGAGGLLAALLARLGVPLFVRAAPADVIPRLGDAGLGGAALLFTLGAAVVAAMVCGLVPALRASAPRMTRLREGGRGATGGHHWGRDALVVGQTALALVLLIGSGLLVRSFLQLRDVDPGYDTEDIFTFQIAPEDDALVDASTYARFHLDFMARLEALPGVDSVGLVENVPLNEGVASGRFIVEGGASDEDEAGSLLGFTWAAGDYFETMGISMLRGRPFVATDHLDPSGNVVVGAGAAELLWPGEEAVGKRLQMRGSDAWLTVVGVVEDVLQDGFRDAPTLLVYLPLQDGGRAITSPAYVMKTTRADSIGPEVRALVGEVAPEAPMYRVFTMAGLAADSMVRLSFTMLTLGIASALAIGLGAIGLFGVLSYVVTERTREIGVRMALGAQARGVRRMVVVQGARVVALGVGIGLAVSVGVTRVLGTLLYGVDAFDVATFVGMSTTMVLIGLAASYLPARRASAVDPIESLRGE